MKKKVFVGLSGGVDSAVSATLLKKQGYEVVGVFIKTWHPDFLECNEEDERRDAMRVAAFLDIPFLTFDLADVYKKEVADYMIREYKEGRTPNPDVMCNKEVKFGTFLKKAISMGADCVATGHYARVLSPCEGGVPEGRGGLLKGKDPSKDQSYFLWTLKQEQLERIVFPIGNLKKTEVRKLAKKFNLPVAEKKDSQGICFLGEIDLKEFLKHYIKLKKGKAAIENLRKKGIKAGLLRIRLLRPFPEKQIINSLKNIKKVIVLDQNISPGSSGILYPEVRSILKNKLVSNYIIGLGGKPVAQKELENIILEILNSDKEERKWLI